MSLWTSNPSKVHAADSYFASFNPMAARIIDVKNRVKHSYSQESWNAMSVDEQEAAVNKQMIPHDAVSRYQLIRKSELPDEYKAIFPKLVVDSGQEIIKGLDDEKVEWRDEHSSPFCWKTRSQMNLNLPSKKSDQKSDKSEVCDPSNVSLKIKIPIPMNKSEGQVDCNKEQKDPFVNGGVKPDFESSEKLRPKVAAPWVAVELVILNQGNAPKSVFPAQPVVLRDTTSKLPKHSEEKTPILFGQPLRDHKKSAASTKNTEPKRFNPRSSLTLDDDDQDPSDDAGAIRNLEVAMREEQNRQQGPAAVAPPVDQRKNSEIEKRESTSSMSSLENNDAVEEDPLIKPSSLFSSSTTDSSNFAGKSGFDFLDNW